MSYQYVYGVVEAGDAIELETDTVGGGESVYPISNRRFAALVSDIDTTDPERTDEDATRHDDVLREIMHEDGGRTVVPMQFGMVFENERALKNVLRGGLQAFRRTIREVEGTVELGLKIIRDEDDSVDREAIEAEIAAVLEPLSEDSVDNGLFSDRLVVNRSYLVDRDARERFDEAIADLEAEHEALTFKYTGPFAPYNFVDIHIGAQ